MMAKKKVQDQGEQILRNEAYLSYAAKTKDEAQRRYWTFYEAIIILFLKSSEFRCCRNTGGEGNVPLDGMTYPGELNP